MYVGVGVRLIKAGHVSGIFLLGSILAPLSGALANDEPVIDPMGALSSYATSLSNATDGRLHVSGYINGHYMHRKGMPEFVGRDSGDLWQIREASLFADYEITPNLLFSTEFEMSYDISSTNRSGRDNKFEGLFNFYYLDWDVASSFDMDMDRYGSLELRAGRILVPFLSYNENKVNFRQNLMSAPFTAQHIVPVNTLPDSFQQYGWTELGATLNWSYDFEDAGIFDLKTSLINGLSTDGPVLDTGTAQLNSPMMQPTVRTRSGLNGAKSSWDDLSVDGDNLAVVVKASFKPSALPLDVGVSWYNGKWDDAGDHDLTMYGVHANYIERDWSLKGEYVRADVEQTAGINPVTAMGPAMLNSSTGDYTMDAWYIEAAYIPLRYDACAQCGERYVKTVVRYDEVDTNDKAMFTPFDRNRITLGAEWRFLDNVSMRYEWQRSELEDYSNAPAPFVAAGGEKYNYMNMVSVIANF